MEDVIAVIDYDLFEDRKCKCGRDAGFVLVVYGNVIDLCEQCIADVGKKIIDGLT